MSMICLACGDCCKRMSPITAPNPCPKLEMHEDIAHCTVYKERPVDCVNHDFAARICPIGLSVLNLITLEEIQQRVYNIERDRRA